MKSREYYLERANRWQGTAARLHQQGFYYLSSNPRWRNIWHLEKASRAQMRAAQAYVLVEDYMEMARHAQP